jgi:hypothetical protein
VREAFTRLIQSDLQLHTGFCVRSGAENGFWGKLGGPEGRPRRGPPTAWRSTSLSSPIVPN